MKKLITRGLIFGADFSLGRALYAKHCSREREHRGTVKNHEYKTEYDASKVLEQMKGFISDFGFASICDLENCIEKIDGEEIKFVRGYDDRDWGWEDLSLASIHRFSGNRFVIKWPFEKNITDVNDEEDSDEEAD